jgi:hypothetical protein
MAGGGVRSFRSVRIGVVTDYLNHVDIAVVRLTDGARRRATTKCALSVRVFADDKEVWR